MSAKSIDEVIDDYHSRLELMPTWTREKRQLVDELSDKLLQVAGTSAQKILAPSTTSWLFLDASQDRAPCGLGVEPLDNPAFLVTLPSEGSHSVLD